MGGGDLNLKKSWHPSTLRNIERVWKAEQKHEAEKQKIEQLQKELAEERAREEIQQFAEDQGVIKKKEEKLDWMYQGPAAMVNREEYLLGRKIDKTFETLQMIEKGEESLKDEGADDRSMFSCQNLSGSGTVDLANKIREDPLFNIMKKEKEERKNLLTNPVKMKQLEKMLKASLGNEKSKKNKKNKKKHHRNDSEEDQKHKKQRRFAASDSEDETRASKKDKKNSKMKIFGKDSSERKSSKYEETPTFNRKQNNGGDTHHRTHERSMQKLSMDYRDYKQFASTETYRSSKELHYSSRESYKESHHSSRESYKESHHSSRESYKESHHSSKESHPKLSQNSNYPSSKERSREESHPYHNPSRKGEREEKKRKLNAEERERLLREMQENAVWREEQRRRNTQRYKMEDEKEERSRIETSDFLKPILSKATGKGSLENRIKQKIFTIQRSGRDMDKNFARRD